MITAVSLYVQRKKMMCFFEKMENFLLTWYNSAKDVHHFCPKGLAARRKWGLG